MTDSQRSNYKSMNFTQLLLVTLPSWMSAKERVEHLAYICGELRVKRRGDAARG